MSKQKVRDFPHTFVFSSDGALVWHGALQDSEPVVEGLLRGEALPALGDMDDEQAFEYSTKQAALKHSPTGVFTKAHLSAMFVDMGCPEAQAGGIAEKVLGGAETCGIELILTTLKNMKK